MEGGSVKLYRGDRARRWESIGHVGVAPSDLGCEVLWPSTIAPRAPRTTAMPTNCRATTASPRKAHAMSVPVTGMARVRVEASQAGIWPKAQFMSMWEVNPGPTDRTRSQNHVLGDGMANACRLIMNLNEFAFVD